MMVLRLLAPALTIVACYGIWSAYENLTLLRGSVLWDLRYVVLCVTAIMVLSLAQWITAKIGSRFKAG